MTKRFSIICLIILLGILTAVYSLPCQYTTNEDYTISRNVFSGVGEESKYSLLAPLDIKQGDPVNPVWGGGYPLSFRIYNNYTQEINVTIKYIVDSELQNSGERIISSYGSTTVTGLWSNGLDENSIEFDIHTPGISSNRKNINYEKEVCKQCPKDSGFTCLNISTNCTKDSECGSGICNLANVCDEIKWVIDGQCSTEVGENCINSPTDCKPGNNHKCDNGKIIEDCDNPPDGMKCCNNNFKKISELSLNSHCDCDFQCNEGQCFQNTCQKLLIPNLRCPNGINVKQGDTFFCNVYMDDLKIGNKIDIELDAGTGLMFLDDCTEHNTSQCKIEFENNTNIGLTASSCGDSNIQGNVYFNYKGKQLSEKIRNDFEKIHVYCCGDGNIDEGENKTNCCGDVGVGNYSFFKLRNEKCEDNEYTMPVNWLFALCIVVLLISFVYICILGFHKIREILAQKKIEELEEIIKELRENIKNLEYDIKNLEDDVKKGEEKINGIKKQIKTASYDAKKALEDNLKKEEEKQKERILTLKKKEEKIKREEEEIEARNIEIINNSYEAYINEMLEKYKKRYDRAGVSVYYDKKEKYFMIEYKSGTIIGLHRYIYSKVYNERLSFNHEIHHIDCDQLNNEIWNLIKLNINVHGKISHGKIQKGDWKSGIEELNRVGISRSDFPKYVRKRMK